MALSDAEVGIIAFFLVVSLVLLTPVTQYERAPPSVLLNLSNYTLWGSP